VSGDGGRDAILYQPQHDEAVVLQYSVATDWKAKIWRTISRLQEIAPGRTKLLIYITNQKVGAEADDLRNRLLQKRGIALDVRDRHWFLERQFTNPQRERAAEDLIERVVEPYLRSRDLTPRTPAPLSSGETHARRQLDLPPGKSS
jgi:hypothetical protein